MLLDRQNCCSIDQALTSGTINSTDVIDLWGAATRDTIPGLVGTTGANALVPKDSAKGNHLDILIQVTGSNNFTGGTSVQAQICGCDDAAYTNPVVLAESAAIATASLVPGYQWKIGVDTGLTQRCLFVRYVIVGTYTLGTVTAGIISDRQSNY
jgi:hypothetical protein